MDMFTLNPIGTTSALGRELRLRRILGEDGRMMTVALDQAVPRGVAPRLADLKSTFDKIMEAEPDAFTVFKGVAGHLLSGRTKQIPLIVKGSTFCIDFHATYDATVGQVADCLRLGADAIAVGISAGSEHQVAMLEMLSAVTEEAHKWGLPVVCHAYPSGELWGDRKGSTDSVVYAARAAAECGTDIVKTWYTGSAEEFRKVVEATPTLVVAAGGAPTKTPMDVLEQAANVMEAGAAGMTTGRNIWGAEDPAKMVRALKAIIHDGAGVSDAAKFLA
ncbi:class I fructose-bisphosphate aldolase [Raineyella fluvialis]|uniref:Fructose-bisphosphate aldolase n=1 Tax=Raineyella fluvialis TaxID=2662261 RepID=A0A5Q2F8U1_9ACTN|nr:fructose-bisphosphate aldolase [Raineyella fluvialis]QGF23259.1 fructose-bisphosphate aldolase [Raineyella fluvialis]